jgi:hypothetical protein
MAAGLAGTAMAQVYSIPLGVTNDVKVGVAPAMLPPGSLPAGIVSVGPDLYVGTLTVTQIVGGYAVQYKGDRVGDGAKLMVNATFNSSWAGIKIAPVIVGTTTEPIIAGIDAANLVSANINGVGTVDGGIRRLIAKVGAGGVVENWKVLKAPGNLR